MNDRLNGKRVVIVLPGLKLGGAERQALLLARYLRDEGRAEVHVWGFNRPERVAEICEAEGIPWRSVRAGWPRKPAVRAKSLARFARTLRQFRPDVVLPYTIVPNVVCGLVWRWTGARVCIWNQRDEGRGFGVAPAWQRAAVRLVPWFISNSRHAADHLRDALGVRQSRIQVIYNGVELRGPEADRAAWRARLGVGEDWFLACMVANLHEYKDHFTLLKAWKRVVQAFASSGRQAALLLAGRPEGTAEDLQRLAAELELGSRVRFLNRVDDVSGLLQAADLGVFSSRFEGCPNGVLECMAAGLAVVGTDIPGIREALGPASDGALAPPGDADRFAERILEFANDPDWRAAMGKANRLRIANEFSPRRMSQETLAAIARLLPRDSRGGPGMESSKAYDLGRRLHL